MEPGSSPLTRGKPTRRESRPARTWLIPAHAGKTAAATACSKSWGAHPRSRGENIQSAFGPTFSRGSSPLTRGKRAGLTCANPAARLIPAHAGKTATRHTAPRSPTAHPRSRGENERPSPENQAPAGSSPLTRGKLGLCIHRDLLPGLIPAHAGKTGCAQPCPSGAPAHPRSRGENAPMVSVLPFSQGSSPLTRGKPGHHRLLRRESGLIPAHAGKTKPYARTQLRIRAHPRSRGENALSVLADTVGGGSSPLTRGKPCRWRSVNDRTRLIPAHAGKTMQAAMTLTRDKAHPRSRGENNGDDLL